VTTIGGGTVLDTRPRRWHDRAAHVAYCAALHEGDIARALALLAERAGAAGVGVADLAAGGLDEREAREAFSTAEEAGELESRAGRWFVAGTAAAAAEEILTALRTLASERPERPQSAPAELAAQVAPFPIEALTSLLADLQKGGRVVETAGGYALVGGATLSQAQERLIAALLERLDAEPFAPPTLATLLQEEGMQRRELLAVLDVLAQRGRVVRADKDLWFTAAAVDEARRRLCEALARAPEITLAGFRDLLGTGRRNAQALLELFDREGLTRRQGDARVLRTRH
jgi:selenocysteine-specific elongation factor